MSALRNAVDRDLRADDQDSRSLLMRSEVKFVPFDFKTIEGSFQVGENDYVTLNGVTFNGTLLSSNVYSSWGWQKGYSFNPDSGDIRTHFTIEGAPPAGYTSGTGTLIVYADGTYSCQGYAIGYY